MLIKDMQGKPPMSTEKYNCDNNDNHTKKRLDIPSAIYYIQLQGQSLRPLFQGRDDYKIFLDYLIAAACGEQHKILGYCLLSQSIHLLVRVPDFLGEHNVYTFVRQINSQYTQYYNDQQKRHGSVFQTQFSCLLIEPAAYLAPTIAMLHRLPIDYGLVAEAGAYPWSSHNLYLQNNASNSANNCETLDWLDTDTGLRIIAKHRASQQRQYRDYIQHTPQQPLNEIDWIQGCHPEYFALASHSYIQQLLKNAKPAAAKSPSLALLTLAICREYGMAPQELLQKRRHRHADEVRAQIVRLSEKWSIASIEHSCRFLACDPTLVRNSLCRLTAERQDFGYTLEQKLTRQLGFKRPAITACAANQHVHKGGNAITAQDAIHSQEKAEA